MEGNKSLDSVLYNLYQVYLEVGHEVFEETIKKPLELYLSYNHDNGNIVSMHSLNINCANDMESFKLVEDEFDEHDINSPLACEDKICYDDNISPIYNHYDNVYAIKNDDCLTLTITKEKNFAYEESSNTFMLVDHEKHVLCDSYFVEFVHDATENYYERGKYGSKSFHVTKTPLFKLKVLKVLLFYLPMLVTMFFMDLFVYKIPMHRKYVRLKCVLYFAS